MSPGNHIVGFDFCGTLFHSNTTFDFLDHLASRLGGWQIMRNLWYRSLGAIARRSAAATPSAHPEMRIRFLKGFSRDQIRHEARIFVDLLNARRPNRPIMKKLTEALASGHECRIISYTLHEIAEAFASEHPGLRVLACELDYSPSDICKGTYALDLREHGKHVHLLDHLTPEQIASMEYYSDDSEADSDLVAAVGTFHKV